MAVELVAQLVAELVQQAGLDKRGRGGIDAGLTLHERRVDVSVGALERGMTPPVRKLVSRQGPVGVVGCRWVCKRMRGRGTYLTSGEADGDNGEVLWLGEELGLDH
jgi:hypothetical protein